MNELHIAIVVSQFNPSITHALLTGTLKRLNTHGINEEHIKVVHVPGAIEIPLTAKRLAQSKQFAAIICLGAIIRGDTDHYDYVCQQVSYGCMQVMLETDTPLVFGILTTKNVKQARARIGGKEGHKGEDAADTAIAMAKLMQQQTLLSPA
jgi:6,7-dimethyl-8-ribityllumazine synthase